MGQFVREANALDANLSESQMEQEIFAALTRMENAATINSDKKVDGKKEIGQNLKQGAGEILQRHRRDLEAELEEGPVKKMILDNFASRVIY